MRRERRRAYRCHGIGWWRDVAEHRLHAPVGHLVERQHDHELQMTSLALGQDELAASAAETELAVAALQMSHNAMAHGQPPSARG